MYEIGTALFIGLLIGSWMYSDAKNRNYKDKWGAFVLGLIFSIFGLIIWFLIRPKIGEHNSGFHNKQNKERDIGKTILLVGFILILLSPAAAFFMGGFGSSSTSSNKPTQAQGGIYSKGQPVLKDAGENSYYIMGELMNNGTIDYQYYNIRIIANLYKGTQLVDSCSGFAETNLPANGESSYKIWCDNVSAFDNYKIFTNIG